MKKIAYYFLLIGLISFGAHCNRSSNGSTKPSENNDEKLQVASWVTTGNQASLLQKQNLIFNGTYNASFPTITINESTQFQTVDGFGYTLTGGSALLINQLSADKKAALLQELFGNGSNDISVNYLRLSIGASDLDTAPFSYNDLPLGQTDVNQNNFSIEPDKANLIPILKQILSINPLIKIIATPWSPPTWMKDNNSTIGGSLKPEYYTSYATYFVKYIKAMKNEGINIDAITPQNEPLHPGNNPSLFMTATQQLDFIKNHLGPAFKTNNINTKIVLYDHNLDRTDYPLSILNDAEARPYIDGTAFHLYAGEVQNMSIVHNAYPDKNLYFTEQWTGANGSFDGDLQWHIKNVIIGTMRNWSKIALEWNLANDPYYQPHTNGGCTECKGALTISNNSYSKNVAYYIIAHASKFIPQGSKRIESTDIANIPSVAFITPSGKKVLIAANAAANNYSFHLNYKNQSTTITMLPNSVATIVW